MFATGTEVECRRVSVEVDMVMFGDTAFLVTMETGLTKPPCTGGTMGGLSIKRQFRVDGRHPWNMVD